MLHTLNIWQNTSTTWFDVGIRFSLIGDFWAEEEATLSMRHWALVFTPRFGPTASHVVEAVIGDKGNVVMLTTNYGVISSHPLALYEGNLSDIDRVLEAHPMRGTAYSACFNNCQHFVATFLLLLDAYSAERKDRSLTITNMTRMKKIQEVLALDRFKIYHSPNPFLQMARFAPIPVIGAAWAAASVAAEATVASTIAIPVVSTVPVAGFWGFLGVTTTVTNTVTTTVIVPAACAATAAPIAPVAGLATLAAGLGYMWKSKEWKDKTRFKNPLFSGFPKGVMKPLSDAETKVSGRVEVKGLGSFTPYRSIESSASKVGSLEAIDMPDLISFDSEPLVSVGQMGGLIVTRR